jgi:hypothetical protein
MTQLASQMPQYLVNLECVEVFDFWDSPSVNSTFFCPTLVFELILYFLRLKMVFVITMAYFTDFNFKLMGSGDFRFNSFVVADYHCNVKLTALFSNRSNNKMASIFFRSHEQAQKLLSMRDLDLEPVLHTQRLEHRISECETVDGIGKVSADCFQFFPAPGLT